MSLAKPLLPLFLVCGPHEKDPSSLGQDCQDSAGCVLHGSALSCLAPGTKVARAEPPASGLLVESAWKDSAPQSPW